MHCLGMIKRFSFRSKEIKPKIQGSGYLGRGGWEAVSYSLIYFIGKFSRLLRISASKRVSAAQILELLILSCIYKTRFHSDMKYLYIQEISVYSRNICIYKSYLYIQEQHFTVTQSWPYVFQNKTPKTPEMIQFVCPWWVLGNN